MTMHRFRSLLLRAFCLCAAGWFAVSVHAQQPGALPSSLPPASVSGSVINSVTGAPLEGVHVMLAKQTDESFSDIIIYGDISDAAGHFSIAGLPTSLPNKLPRTFYDLRVERRGFVTVRDKRGSVAAYDSQLRPGQQLRDVTLRMAPQAILSGLVLDEYGDPMMNVFMKAVPVPPTKVQELDNLPFPTNDRGEFRLSVPPGKYYIFAGSWPLLDERSQTFRDADTAESAYHPTYYPSATEAAAATPVEAQPGREISGLEIRMARTPVLKISGVVTGTPDCASLPSVFAESDAPNRLGNTPSLSLQLEPSDHTSAEKFQFSRVAPGLYKVYAHCSATDHELKSQVEEVTLTDSHVQNLGLTLTPGPKIKNITGKVEWTASSLLSPEQKEGRTVTLVPQSKFGEHQRQAEVAPDGNFKIKDVFPDRYAVEIVPLPENAFVMAVRLSARPVPDGILDLTNGAEGARLRITLSANGGQVTGWVTDDDEEETPSSGTVVIFQDKEGGTGFESWCDLRLTPEGAYYGFAGLRPGKYRLLVTPLAFSNQDEVKEFINQNRGNGAVIEIKKEGDKISKDLTMSGEDPDENEKR